MSTTVEWNGLTRLEVAASVVFGRGDEVHVGRTRAESPAAALEETLLEALSRPPCGVSFSGGRDSSLLLALAAGVARREQLPEPIPITARYPGIDEASEDEWQQQVIKHLQISDWVRLAFDDEGDLVGQFARPLLRRGIPYPYNLHLHVPLVREVRGGSLVTGVGGDEAFGPVPRALAVLARRVRPRRGDALRLVGAVAPRRVKRALLRREPRLEFPWLSEEANRELAAAWIEEQLRYPFRWDESLREWRRARYTPACDEEALGSRRRRGRQGPTPIYRRELRRRARAEGWLHRLREPNRRDAAVVRPPSSGKGGSPHDQGNVRPGALESLRALICARATHGRSAGDGPPRARPRRPRRRRLLAAHWSGDAPKANSFLLLQACWIALDSRSRPVNRAAGKPARKPRFSGSDRAGH